MKKVTREFILRRADFKFLYTHIYSAYVKLYIVLIGSKIPYSLKA